MTQPPRPPTDAETQLRAQLADAQARLKALLDEAALNERVMRRAQEQEIELLRAESLPDLLRRATAGLQSAYGLDAVTLVIEDPNHEVRHLLIGTGEHPEDLGAVRFVDTLGGLAPQLPALQRPWLGRFVRPDHQLLFPGVEGLQSMALLPLRRGGRLTGTLNFGSRDAERFTHRLASDFLAHLAGVVAVCLENGCNRARVLKSGLADYLTGWHTRRYLHARLREEIGRAQRRSSSIACLMMDVDHFKAINDTFGHMAGDEALREVTSRIESLIRASDVAARFGGDELALLLPDTDAPSARQLVLRIQQALATPVELAPGRPWPITLSIGLAALRPTRADNDYKALAERLLAEADVALYRAKAAGRNRLAVAGEPDEPASA